MLMVRLRQFAEPKACRSVDFKVYGSCGKTDIKLRFKGTLNPEGPGRLDPALCRLEHNRASEVLPPRPPYGGYLREL
jgi:hypothetical protein